ncbi:zinc ribbon domain-containing protein [Demequina lignilytica]|uniref:C4-type zinc ribbon domain-containing protein n=1 Tax=Demequina lignilytica TaxID=3051663 RepID=A0AAW7M235_9MICO|nr:MULTISPECIES: C4-type zinc ribbon domain-containing protein [unclassified Demequina]MDN4478538.1 C4-type zinc ribbon domain-containing protein [Demequina sp. SYSU T00039-1]MDN4482304.1 C4-type zinc ribbon domain-containing protein [Demequina sp. SYSU T0a273]MDN4486955.1 C4-type zinc ribbon domain-containing protein [Demequina sp. SYSU T00039]MDN4489639.1 C4-type zinc ribbon domain-containing protein [Demequina sp. SYSU T00068]
MPSAPVTDQIRLLEVQDLDLRTQQARHRRDHLPVVEQIAELRARLTDLDEERVARSTEVSDIKREVAKAEDDVEVVRSRAARDTARLESGQGTPKDLQALASELEVLKRRQSALEDVELEAMDRLETAEAALASAKEQVEAIQAQVTALESERDQAWEEIDAELVELAAQRTSAAFNLDADMMALYEKLRASHGGIGAAALQHGECLGCRMKLNPADLRDIEGRPDDAVVRCEECGRILVRGAGA